MNCTPRLRHTPALMFCLALVFALTGCGDNSGGAPGGAASSGSTSGANDPLVVGFSQIGAESDWRRANTESIQSTAEKRGIDLRFSDAQQKQENQIKALRSFVAQGVDVIAFSPVVETGWEPVLEEIKRAGIPVILTDRKVDVDDPSLYTSFIGSDFVEEGRKAGRWLAEKTGGQATIAQLEGTPGSAPAIDRAKGFKEIIDQHPGMKIVWSQSGNFTRVEGKKVFQAFLKSPEAEQVNALFSHNDDMALGAIQAIKEAGMDPGDDIVTVSIDGVKTIFQAMVDGDANCTVECNPLLGPKLFDVAQKLAAGEDVPKEQTMTDHVFDQAKAAGAIDSRKY